METAFSKNPSSPDSIELWFQMIYNEIQEIQSYIDLKEGFLFFKKHAHSRDEILAFPNFKKIYALCGQIDDIVISWRSNDSISDDRYRFYHESRLNVERRMGELRARIIERKPTFWENFLDALVGFAKFVLNSLPLLAEEILNRIGFAPTLQQKLLMDMRKGMSRIVDEGDDL